MRTRIGRVLGSAVVVALVATAGAAPAVAAGHRRHHRHHHRTNASRQNSSGQGTQGNGETPLTGSTLTSASAAAINANPGATVDSASTETDSSISGAAYEVHITQPDGSHAVVIEDSGFNVLATQAEGAGGCDHGSGGNGETPLTGATLASASAAATNANPGATVDSASTETDSLISGAAYEVHITQPDGSHAVVIEDSGFNVLATQAEEPDRH